jgi:signal transduction histidine kinase
MTVSDPTELNSPSEVMGTEFLSRSLIEIAAEPLLACGADGAILVANRAAHRLAECNPLLRSFDDVFCLEPLGVSPVPEHEETDGAARRLFEDLLKSPTAYRYRSPSGQERTLMVNAAFLEGLETARPGYVISMTDISAERERETQLSQARKETTDAGRDLQQFVYSASHDLQEPLRMVTSYLQLIERRYGSSLDHEALEFLEFAVEGANRMHQQINDLLAYSRVMSRGGPVKPTGANAALAAARSQLEQKEIEAGAEITSERLPSVLADSVQLAQVFRILIENALMYRSEAPLRIHIGAVRDGDMVRFLVRDNGIGIAPEFHERIFQMFQRLHTRDQYPGTGIGLSIVRRIMERHGGRCWVESVEGEGSTFFFTVPGVPVEGESE